MRTTLGYTIFIISCFIWGSILVVPWFGFSKGQLALITTILIVAGEITFYVSIFILGKAFYQKFKTKLMFWKRKPENIEEQPPQ